MATYGKYQVYYEKIKTEVEKIREENGYLNLSKAFAHWYLKNTLKMDEQDIAETIIDGNGDNGIDAITVQDAEMTLYQFKFPDKGKNIDKQIDEKTVLKIFNGYKKLVSVRKPRSMNENFLKFREIVKEKNIFDYKVVFISFSNGFSQPALDAFESESEDIRDTNGGTVSLGSVTLINNSKLYVYLPKNNNLDLYQGTITFRSGLNVVTKQLANYSTDTWIYTADDIGSGTWTVTVSGYAVGTTQNVKYGIKREIEI